MKIYKILKFKKIIRTIVKLTVVSSIIALPVQKVAEKISDKIIQFALIEKAKLGKNALENQDSETFYAQNFYFEDFSTEGETFDVASDNVREAIYPLMNGNGEQVGWGVR